MFKVYVKEKEFNVKVIDDKGKEMFFDVNTAIFDDKIYRNSKSKMNIGLSFINQLNINSKDYHKNAILGLIFYGAMPTIKYDFDFKIELKNEMECYSFVDMPDENIVKEYAQKIVHTTKKLSKETIYEVKSFEEVIFACILHFSQYGYPLKRCLNCNKFFIPKTTKDTKFCYRIDEQVNMRCNDAYKYKQRLIKEEEHESVKLHKKIYNNLRNRRERTKDEKKWIKADEVLKEFTKTSEEKRNLYIKGIIKEDEYIKWLKSYLEK